mmetsp:Transcript_45465/g.101624  ORF Transcript_45465/g.101624 Transcript_45465/m.101624 type:complete len:308 (+) Transcript_45465:207-1130(+)
MVVDVLETYCVLDKVFDSDLIFFFPGFRAGGVDSTDRLGDSVDAHVPQRNLMFEQSSGCRWHHEGHWNGQGGSYKLLINRPNSGQVNRLCISVQYCHHLSYTCQVLLKGILQVCTASRGPLNYDPVLIVDKEAHIEENAICTSRGGHFRLVHLQCTSHLRQAVLPSPGHKVGLLPARVARDPVHKCAPWPTIPRAHLVLTDGVSSQPECHLHVDEGRVFLSSTLHGEFRKAIRKEVAHSNSSSNTLQGSHLRESPLDVNTVEAKASKVAADFLYCFHPLIPQLLIQHAHDLVHLGSLSQAPARCKHM